MNNYKVVIVRLGIDKDNEVLCPMHLALKYVDESNQKIRDLRNEVKIVSSIRNYPTLLPIEKRFSSVLQRELSHFFGFKNVEQICDYISYKLLLAQKKSNSNQVNK